ncbi:hybrid sensor histidine kinase/response regulator transcription factor [Aliiglaciecola sp. LCG003]|uniref:hybrid sensor histidine kinase/response regulator transcription factor n=1 Tax=Aliiglaciecola sp. LCG003 TaxID=3053655 RepID=UPI00257401F1|nr:hybrid sensor histidine kinase/response regulator transcription factor [Aliiglaciecola sp. LCG003]WJG09878.1 ATP-binding protein [Aliiglaciecola sp. LCG003]
MRQKLIKFRHSFILGIFIIASLFSFSGQSATSETVFLDKPIGTVYAVHRGQKALWFGGENGLFSIIGPHASYFGPEVTNINTDIEDLYEDELGRLWIATFGNGILIYDGTSFTKQVIETEQKIAGNYCRNVTGALHFIFVSCGGSVYKYSMVNHKMTQVLDFKIFDTKDITKIYYANEILFVIDSYSRLFKIQNSKISEVKLNSLKDEHRGINTLFLNNDNLILIGTTAGLIVYDLFTNTDELFFDISFKSSISQIFETSNGKLWIYQYGFKLVDFKEGLTTPRQTPAIHLPTYNSSEIYDVEVLSNGGFIFSAPLIGLSSYSEFSSSLTKLNMLPSTIETIQYSLSDSDDVILAIEDKLFMLELKSNSIRKVSDYNGFVNSISRIGKETLIVTSDELGLQILHENELGKYESTSSQVDINGGFISSILPLSDSKYLLGISGGNRPGLYQYQIDGQLNILAEDVVVDLLLKTIDGRVFIALRLFGILELDLDELKSMDLSHNVFVNAFINNCLLEDRDGLIWICTDGGGLGYYDLESKSVQYIDSKHTGGSRHIRELLQDTDGYFWVMTNQGLIRYDHKNKTSIRIGKEEGINDVDFEITASLNLPNDQILVAGDTENYLINTKTANIYLNERVNKVTEAVFVDFEVLNREGHGTISKRQALNEAISQNEAIEISNDEYLFRIKFAANNFIDRKILGFEYRLKGLDETWIDGSPSEYTATYSTLPSGTYTFEVRVKDPKSFVEQPISSIRLSILPPIWQTWPAYMFYIIFCCLSLLLFFKYRTIQSVKFTEKLEDLVLGRTIELARSQNKLGKMLRDKEALYANASHELRTPLTLISGPLEQINDLCNNNEQKKYIEIVGRNAHRISNIIDQILVLSQIDSCRANEKILYDLHKSISIIVEAFRSTTRLKDQTLIFDNRSEGNARLINDSLEQILSNLLVNAYKYTPKYKNIEVYAYNENDYVVIQVSDQGLGIKQEDLTSIFDRFTRLSNAQNIVGTGLGLAVVKELIHANGGTISVESSPGLGATFTVHLPISDINTESKIDLKEVKVSPHVLEDSPTFEFEKELEEANTDQLETVLIVEDDMEMSSYLCDLLSEKYHCMIANNGEHGIQKAIEAIPDLILSDVMMPKIDGFELSDAIRENDLTCHIPIVLLTAKADLNSQMDGWTHNVDDYIFKPFNKAELLARIRRLLVIREKVKNHFAEPSQFENEKNLFEISDTDFYSERDRLFFEKFVHLIETNYLDRTFDKCQAADLLAVSDRQLSRKLNALTNFGFVDLLRKYRLNMAKQRLIEGGQISNVAYDVGFSSPSYFSHCFKDEFGLSPKAFVEQIQQH